jgi:hypothetical protein
MKLSMTRDGKRGQTLVEFALVFPIFMLVLFGIIIFGLGVFYQQQLSNAVREAARYAAVHSSTAQCPTISHIRLDDPTYLALKPDSWKDCDRPNEGWPKMTSAARSSIWGMAPTAVSVVACWSGFVGSGPVYNEPPDPGFTFTHCTMRAAAGGQIDPQANGNGLACPITASDTVDTASEIAYANGRNYPTTVTVYACFNWTPPMAGFLFLPSQVTLRAIATEVLQRQQ